MDNYLVIRKIKILEAGMDSSPVTRGFPSIPAIMGFVHAMQRRLQSGHPGLKLTKAGASCHFFAPGLHDTRVGKKVSMTKNPAHAKKHLKIKDGVKSIEVPFIEEGKADLTLTMIILIEADSFEKDRLIADIAEMLPHLRLSGGTIWGAEEVQVLSCSKDDQSGQRMILHKLMPGFVLQERKDLVEKSMEQGVDALDAILDHLEVSRTESDDQPDRPAWVRKSGEPGWLVPVSVGYRALSEPGYTKNQRAPDYKHCFAENVLTLGEFVMPIRLDRIEQLLWQPRVDENQGFYLYTQSKGRE